MAISIYQVDAFSQEAFRGNPAAVCLLDSPLDARTMQNISIEMSLSETAFLEKREDGWGLRWFTPVKEVDLCGHATLASAHILWEIGKVGADEQICFHTRSGELTADNEEGLVKLNFPALDYVPVEIPASKLDAFGVSPLRTWRFGEKELIEVASEEEVRRLQPDFGALREMPGRGVVVTSISESEKYDFISRYFAPWVGVDEDPVTGSVHCCLGPYWGARLEKQRLTAFQASARGGFIEIELLGDRVYLGGYAVTVLEGELVY